MHRTWHFFCIALILLLAIYNVNSDDAQSYRRVKRGTLPLLFYGGSTITFIFGFGVPVQDLDSETVVVGNVFKCYYQLPAKPEQLKSHDYLVAKTMSAATVKVDQHILENHSNGTQLHAHSRLSKYRWLLYQGMAQLAEKLGQPGRVCVLKSICEVAAIPFHHHNGIIGELAHLILTPSASKDETSALSSNEYYYAEAAGKSGRRRCEDIFSECKRSLLDYFTKIF